MSNNKMYLKIGNRKILLAKGTGIAWYVGDKENIGEKLQNFFDKEEIGENYAMGCCVDYELEYETDKND